MNSCEMMNTRRSQLTFQHNVKARAVIDHEGGSGLKLEAQVQMMIDLKHQAR